MTLRAKIEDGIVYSPYPSADVPELSVHASIKRCFQQYGDTVAAIEGDATMTYSELLSAIERYGAGFQSFGIGVGDRVCVHLGNKFENLIAMYGIVAAGGTVVCAMVSLTARELLYQVKDSDSTFVLTDAQNAGKVAEVDAVHKLKGLFAMDDIPGFVPARQFRELPRSLLKEPDIKSPKEEVFAVLYTSGTTGLPKGVEVTHYGFVANVATAAAYFPQSARSGVKETILLWAPVTHAAGFMYSMLTFTLGATRVVSEPGITLQEFVEIVNKNEVTTVSFFPTMLQAYVDAMERTGMRTPSVRTIGVGGGNLPPHLAQKALKVFDLVSFRNSYSLTEACGVVCISPPGAMAYDTIGFPAPMVQIKIVDIGSGNVLGVNEPGELMVKLPNVMKGYYKNPEATAAVLSPDGWMRTGDYAYYDETGRFYFVERLKDVIKCLDTQVAPAELEEILLGHPAVAEVAVVGVSHPKYGEAPTAYVVLKPGHGQDSGRLKAEMKELVARQCAKHKHLYGGINFVDTLPKTETGKVQRSALRSSHVRECH